MSEPHNLNWKNLKQGVITVQPQLEYASTVWSPWQKYLVNAIEKVQRCSARYIKTTILTPVYQLWSKTSNGIP